MTDAEPVEERVRPCLACGTVLPFDAEACSLCGTRTRGAEEEAVKPCLACGALLAEEDFFCSACGDFTGRVAVDPTLPPPQPAETVPAVAFLPRVVAIAILLAAVTLVALAASDWWRVREIVTGAG